VIPLKNQSETALFALRGGKKNIDNFTTSNFNNEKGNLVRAFIRQYELDGLWGQEAGLNWDLMPHSGKLESMFQTENALYSIAAHNVNSKIARQQYGGTFALAFSKLATRATESEVDPTGLGHWSWIQFSGQDGHNTKLLSVYQSNHTNQENSERVYAQHRLYFRSKHCNECPREILIDDLRAFLVK
jgi:hypothetical protein